MRLAMPKGLLAAAVIGALATGALAAKPITGNVRYLGYKKGRAVGRPALLLVVAPESGRKNYALVVANQDFKGQNFDPPPAVIEFVKRLTRGDRLQVTYVAYSGQLFVTGIKPLKVKSVETPFFVYWERGEKRIGTQQFTYVVVGKGVQKAEVLIPNVRGADRKFKPDPKLLAKIAELQPSTPVDVKIRKAGRFVFLVDIGVYLRALTVTFIRSGVAKIGDRKHFAMAAKLHDREVVIPLLNTDKDPKKDPSPDPKLRQAVLNVQPGQAIKIKLRLADEKAFLKEIVSVDPIANQVRGGRPPTRKPTPKDDPNKTKPDDDKKDQP